MSEVHEMKTLTLKGEEFNSFQDQQARGDILKKLPLPDRAAAVGQYLRVLSVDAEGKITALEAVNAPSGDASGSGGNTNDVEDGFSPIATVTQTDTGAIISITDANGTTTATVTNGKDGADGAKGEKGDKGDTGSTGAAGSKGQDGYTPVKGVDYCTDADMQEWITELKSDISWLDGYDIPKLYLTGDITGISKDNAVTLSWAYGENNGSCTLKWQGNSSVSTGHRLGGKMNFTINLDTAVDVGYGEQKKYCLKANAIDHSHARNIVSARLWGMMAASRSHVHENLAASPNYGAIDGFPVAIVLNGKFHGLYTFNIPKDDWMMNMGSGAQECILCADHSTAAQFKGEALCDGSDFEIEYVTDESNTAWVAPSVNRLINACINSNGSDLDTTIARYLDWESAIDYYILVALMDGQDMTDKNYLLFTYDGVKWSFGAYDMDSTYGLKWDASGFSKASYGDKTSFVNYANLHRVMELIKRFKTNALRARYAELRADVLSEATIAREFERFGGTIPSRLLDEDRNKWPLLPLTSVNNIFQILGWLNRRLASVDKWMEDLPAQEEAAGPSYTNVIDTAGYSDGYRLSSSGAESAQDGSTVTGFIELPYDGTTGLIGNPIIRIKGVTIGTQADVGFRCYFCTYLSNKELGAYTHYDNFVSNAANAYNLTYDETTGVYTIDFSTVGSPKWVQYIRFNAKGSGADMIVTVNEEIS